MNKDKLTHRIEKLLISLHKQIVDIRDSELPISRSDMDQTMADVRALHEEFVLLNYFNSLAEIENSSSKAKLTIASSAATDRNASAAEKASEPAFITQSEPEPEVTLTPPAADSFPHPPSVSHADVIPIMDSEPSPLENPAIALGELKELTLADKLRLQKLDDLNKAISMADKFLFINDLFKGENSAYKEALNALNAISNQFDADHYLAQLGKQFGWEENTKTEKKFRELVSRKFA